MKYRYSARTQKGELQVGYIEAQNRDAASAMLSGHDLYVLSVEEVRPPRWYHAVLFFFRRVKRKDLAIFTRQFATMLEAKIGIHDSLDALYYQTSNAQLKEVLFEVSNDIDAGLALSQALEKHGDVFFEFYVSLIQSAEVTGKVEEAVGFLADYLEKELILSAKVKNALIYPVFVVVLAIIVGGILIGLVFPQISPLFSEADVSLPLITNVFLTVGTFINDWWVAIIVFSLVVVVILIDYLHTREGKAVLDQVVFSVPVLGDLFRKLYIARFSQIASVLISGGIPIAQALEIGGHTVGSTFYREALHDVAQVVRRGELLSKGLRDHEKLFPPIVSQMVSVGEQTGKIDQMFTRIGAFYSREVDNVVSNLVELIQPVLMIVIGVLVGFLFAAILLPIYNLIQVIR
ncbi:type II secretion system F family protein [Candidatus Uhrbacteria bacterium]|nr:type II secretion system F family protein [Candidatus Uhrbacteria bacterium]